MAAFVAKQAFQSLSHMGEKPHSSISDWIEILSSERYREDDYDGIPELVDSINLQSEGVPEASRAIRKKLKYGNVHRQLRALTILRALVENCSKFQANFANDRLIDRIKLMAGDSLTDDAVKKKLMSVLASWHRQFKDQPGMSLVAGLYVSLGGGKRMSRPPPPRPDPNPTLYEQHVSLAEEQERLRAEKKAKERREKEEEKRRAKEAKNKKDVKPQARTKRPPFDFEKEKPQILTSIASASQASNNLINALKLVNREQESIQTNERVQECLTKAKAARKVVVRYVQLVENEELIGTLLDTNERIIAALQMYDKMLKPPSQDSEDEASPTTLANRLEATNLQPQPDKELEKLQEKQRAVIERANSIRAARPGASVHPDLRDLSFGNIGSNGGSLPPPLRPSIPGLEPQDETRGSLSDFSDYDSSDEESHQHAASSSSNPNRNSYGNGNRAYANVIPHGQEDEEDIGTDGKHALLDPDDDPFADPSDVGTPGIAEKKLAW